MSDSTISYLSFVTKQVVVYVGFFLFVTGLIGCTLSLIVFISLRTFRESSCAFYLIAMSTINIFHLFTGLLTFIMINGFSINWSDISIFYCKFRSFCVQLCVLSSFSCMCLASIDQFLATCSHPRWQQWCNLKLARYLLVGTGIIWILHGIPFLLYIGHTVSPITGKVTCTTINAIFLQYQSFFHTLVLSYILPVMIMILFGLLAYRNVQQIAYRTVPLVRRELDKQLTVMVLVHVFYDIVVLMPSIIVNILIIIYSTSNNQTIIMILNLIRTLSTIIYYFHFVGSFYIYVCVSKRFRQQLFYVLFTIHLNRFRHRIRTNNNQVEPQI